MSKKSNKKETTADDIFSIELSSYIKPKLIEYKTSSKPYVLNGKFHSFFEYIDKRYDGSPTNSAIINGYVDRLYGKGLTVINANINAGDYARVMRILPAKEVRKIVFDYYKYGSAIVQVRFAKSEKRLIAECNHLERKCVAPSVMDDDGEITSHWFCQDFRRTQTFEPKEYPAYGTSKKEIEILEIRPYKSGRDYFADPGYLSGLQYAVLEEEIANFSVNHIMNGLSAGVVINFNNGKPTTEVKQDIKRKVNNTLTGSGGAKIIFSFNETKDEGVTVEQLGSDNNTEQWQFWAGEARAQIMVAHQVVSPILFGVKTNTGLGNNANEIEEATKLLNQTVIAPRRMAIIDDFQALLSFNDISSPLMFKPLEDEAEDIKEDGTEEEKQKVELNKGFDPNQPRDKNGMWTDSYYGIDVKNMVDVHNEFGGSTFSIDGEDQIGKAGMASVSTHTELSFKTKAGETLTIEMVEDYLEKNKLLLSDSGAGYAIGTWLDTDTGITYVDVVTVTDLDNAIILGRKYNQIAVFDLENLEEIPTGGDGKAKTELELWTKKKEKKEWLGTESGLQNPGNWLSRLRKWFLNDPKNSEKGPADLLIELGDDDGMHDFEVVETREVEGHSLSETDLNLSIKLSGLIPGDARETSDQDTSLFKIRYAYMGDISYDEDGNNITREFCQKLLKANKVYKHEDLVEAENMVFQERMGPEGADTYSIWLYKGGVNCKHFWQRKVYLRKNNKSIGVNEARRLILELDPPDRQEAKWETNRKEVAQIASKSNDFWRYNPKKKVELNEGFDPNQPRDENGMWTDQGGLGKCHQMPKKFDNYMDNAGQTEKLLEYTTWGNENQFKRTVWVDWFLGERVENKNRIAYEINQDPELERGMKSALYDFWKQESEEGRNSSASFSEFQEMEIELYRGVSSRNLETGSIHENGFTSFALMRGLAERWADRKDGEVRTYRKKVSDLYGAVNIVGGEIEVLEPQPYSEEFVDRLVNERIYDYRDVFTEDEEKKFLSMYYDKPRKRACAHAWAERLLKERKHK